MRPVHEAARRYLFPHRRRCRGRPNLESRTEVSRRVANFEDEAAEITLYEYAGGEEALHRLEEIFYAKVLADPLLTTLFTERRPHHVDHLTWFTAESFGGPGRFTRELGFEHIIDVHRGLKITDEQRERFVKLYMQALDDASLPDDERFREAVRSHIEFGALVAQQNSWAETDAELHPIRKVPRWRWPPAND
jgi:hemoglobin